MVFPPTLLSTACSSTIRLSTELTSIARPSIRAASTDDRHSAQPMPEMPEVTTAIERFQLGKGTLSYLWVDNWAKIPQTRPKLTSEDARAGETTHNAVRNTTHSIALSETGNVIVYRQTTPSILIFDSHGTLLDAWGDRFPGAHGLTLVKELTVDDAGKEQAEERLWLTDTITGEVVKTTLEGETVLTLQPPGLPFDEAIDPSDKPIAYQPTDVAVDEERFGGTGDIWVADGHGSGSVHCYDKHGRYIQSMNGTEGAAGAFDCPHSIWIDIRKIDPELYIADRGNHRIQVYDLEGNYKRNFGHDFLTSPCGFAAFEEHLIIPELHARVTILDGQDNLVCLLGENEPVCEIDGWPNHPSNCLMPGRFNSPHSVAADPFGNIYVTEWIAGGRITKLVKRLIA